jgi:uncharacterized protein (DUF983 family)
VKSSSGDQNFPEYSARRFAFMMSNAAGWKCPACGIHPMFVPWHRARNLQDWMLPLDGCPRCGYPFEREPGYFLLAIFAINYSAGALLGLVIYLILEFWVKLPIWQVLIFSILPMPFFNIWFVRHSKAFFLAFDLFCDPHHREDDQGDEPANLPLPNPKKPSSEPVIR